MSNPPPDQVDARFRVEMDGRGVPPPEALALMRTRTHLSRIFANWPQPGCIGLPASRDRHDELLGLGAYVTGEDPPRAFCERRLAVRDELQAFTPFIGRRHIDPILVQSLPATARAGSLETFLSTESWRAISAAASEAAGGVCEICGDGSTPCETHELWEYHSPADAKIEGVQRLVRLLCLCPDCHRMFHPVMAEVSGRIDVLRERLAAVNACSVEEVRQAYAWDVNANRARSRFDWVMDLSVLGDVLIAVDRSWSIQEGIWRFAPDRERSGLADGNTTLPLGIGFQAQGETYDPIDPGEHYELLAATA